MELVLELFKMLWAKSDPLLLVCLLMLGWWQYKTSAKLDAHVNANAKENPYPHPQCQAHEICYENLLGQIKQNREAAATSHNELRTELQTLNGHIDTVLKIAVSRREEPNE
jgi:hypothetical protein